jgi:hypothetical protein
LGPRFEERCYAAMLQGVRCVKSRDSTADLYYGRV